MHMRKMTLNNKSLVYLTCSKYKYYAMRNLLRLIIVLAMSFTSSYISAQDTVKYPDTTNSRKININNLYIEFLGQGIWSLNYERVLQKKSPLAFRGGLSYIYIQESSGQGQIPDYHILVVPLSFSLLFGKKNSFLETGMGVSYVNTMQAGYAATTLIMGNIIVGYRRQVRKGLLFRISYTPIIYLYSDEYMDSKHYAFGISGVLLWGGLSIGYSFPNSKKSK